MQEQWSQQDNEVVTTIIPILRMRRQRKKSIGPGKPRNPGQVAPEHMLLGSTWEKASKPVFRKDNSSLDGFSSWKDPRDHYVKSFLTCLSFTTGSWEERPQIHYQHAWRHKRYIQTTQSLSLSDDTAFLSFFFLRNKELGSSPAWNLLYPLYLRPHKVQPLIIQI